MNKLDIGTSLIAVGVACILLTELTGPIALDCVALEWVACDRIALWKYWASH